jgi:hypothetical protein
MQKTVIEIHGKTLERIPYGHEAGELARWNTEAEHYPCGGCGATYGELHKFCGYEQCPNCGKALRTCLYEENKLRRVQTIVEPNLNGGRAFGPRKES